MLAAGLLLLSGGGGALAEGSDCAASLAAEDAAAIRAVVETYRTSWLAGDEAGVLATFTDDAVLLPAGGAAPIVGIDAIRRYWFPADTAPPRITRLDISVEQLTGDCRVAYSHGRDDVAWEIVEQGKTKPYGHPGTYLNVFAKLSDGSWRISRHMWGDGHS